MYKVHLQEMSNTLFLLYWNRSQKPSALQKEAGLFLSCQGQAMSTMLGCSLTPSANDIHKQTVGRN